MNIYRPKSSIDQIVYLKQVNRRHEVIGYATVTTQRRQHLEDILTKMKKEAAVMGGDAITGIEIEAAGSWKKLPLQKFIGNGYVHARFRGSVIAFQ